MADFRLSGAERALMQALTIIALRLSPAGGALDAPMLLITELLPSIERGRPAFDPVLDAATTLARRAIWEKGAVKALCPYARHDLVDALHDLARLRFEAELAALDLEEVA